MILQAMPPCPLRNKAFLRNIEPPCLTETRSSSCKCDYFTSGVTLPITPVGYVVVKFLFGICIHVSNRFSGAHFYVTLSHHLVWLVKAQPKDNHINKGFSTINGFNSKLQWPVYPNAQIYPPGNSHIPSQRYLLRWLSFSQGGMC